MLTNVTIENFKKLARVSIPLSSSLVLVGPNNSGKSTVFQALCLWETGVENFVAAHRRKELNEDGTATVNRLDLSNGAVSDVRFLWKDGLVSSERSPDKTTERIPLSVELQGENGGMSWTCKVEFTFSNPESFSCRIVSGLREMIDAYDEDRAVRFGYLPSMSGISAVEDKLHRGAVLRRLGEGKTAEVLRNICHGILYPETPRESVRNPQESWNKLCANMRAMFGVDLLKPEFKGYIQFQYVENNVTLDISSGGSGFLQTLLLFTYMYSNPGTVLLLDEPDTHLESIRQRETFQRIHETARETGTQVIISSHSEVVLDEAAEVSDVIALVENRAVPLNVASKPQSLRYMRKMLTDIGWEKYYSARVKGHVLYLEGATDLQMLLCFASILKHKAEPLLRTANVQYTSDNVPWTAINNFVSLSEIFNELKGLALFDNIPGLRENPKLRTICWNRRKLENYFARPELLVKHAGTLDVRYPHYTAAQLRDIMRETVAKFTIPAYLENLDDEWWNTAKLSDEWLDRIFPEFYKRIGANVGVNFKKDYCQLVSLLDAKDVPNEISEKLDAIYETIVR